MERENFAGDAKGKGTSGDHRKAESTDASVRGGLPRSSAEGSVMELERRGQVIVVGLGPTGHAGRSPPAQRKAAAFVRWHEPYDARVSRTDVRPAKAGMFSRSQSYRGNSQKPRSLDSRVAGNQDPEAYRQGLPWGDYEPPGRNDSERKRGLESE